MFSFIRKIIICALVFCHSASAAQVSWGSEAQSVDLSSTGSLMDSTWVFELGGFTPGFVPAGVNTANWAANWTAVSRVAYDRANRAVSGPRFTYSANTGVLTPTNRGWIWGYQPVTGECILIGDSTWLWPDASAPFSLPVTWGVFGARQVVIGTINTGNVQMRSAPLNAPLPQLSFTAWQAIYFTAAERGNVAISGPNADPDGDRIANALEYMLGTSPRIQGALPAVVLPGIGVDLTISRSAAGTLSGNISPDLLQWFGSPAVVATSTAGGIRFSPANAAGYTQRAFWRFHATPAL